MTEVFINGQLIDSIESEIALTLQNFKFDSMGSRKGSFSNVFDLPKTNANKLLFENCDLVTSLTNIPYQSNDCEIFVDGIRIITGTAIIRETKENYRVFISAGNSDFFKQIGSQKIKDVDLADFNHLYNLQDVPPLRESTEGFVYPNIDYGFFEQRNLGSGVVPLNFLQPSFYIKTIIDRSFASFNYTLKGDLLESLIYRKGIVLCKGAEASQTDSFVRYRQSFNQGDLPNQLSAKINFFERIQDKNNLYNLDVGLDHFVYTPNQVSSSETSFIISFAGRAIADGNKSRLISESEIFVILIIYDDQDTEFIFTATASFPKTVDANNNILPEFLDGAGVDLRFNFPQADDQSSFDTLLSNTADLTTLRFGWQVAIQSNPLISLADLRFQNIEFSINQQPRFGQFIQSFLTPVNASEVLPQSDTVADLLLTIANLEGIIFQVDESTKIVNTSRLDKVLDRKGQAYDWSNKIDLSDEVEVFYTLENFAQSNIYKFADDDKDRFLPNNFGQGIINVNNDNIQTEKIVFESKFAPVPLAFTFRGQKVMGKVFTGEKYSFDGTNWNLNDPLKIEQFQSRIAIISESQASIQIQSAVTPNNTNFEVIPLELDFERAINDNYKLIRSVLVNTKVIKALFLLDLEDITNLDFTRPVFVDYFGEYFYIESINQFKVNKRESCFVTLVRI